MLLSIFDALMPYFGGKRRFAPIIFRHIMDYLPEEQWTGKTFVDAFLGSGAVSIFAKWRGFKVIANDIAERSYIAGQALIQNNDTMLTDVGIQRLFFNNPDNNHFIRNHFASDVFTPDHADFLDNAFANARKPLDKYLLIKYIFYIRPYSKFSSPNAFNRPMAEGQYDHIKKKPITKLSRIILRVRIAYCRMKKC